jgi:hypothetical protein
MRVGPEPTSGGSGRTRVPKARSGVYVLAEAPKGWPLSRASIPYRANADPRLILEDGPPFAIRHPDRHGRERILVKAGTVSGRDDDREDDQEPDDAAEDLGCTGPESRGFAEVGEPNDHVGRTHRRAQR